MKLSIKNTFRNLVIAALGAVVLSACGGAGNCNTCFSNSTANTGSLDKLSMVAPSSYPAAIAVTVPVVVTNNGTETINNLNYEIESASNTTGGTIMIQAASAANCRVIAANASCTLNADIAATPASHPGSFSVATSQGAAKSGISAFLASRVLSINVNIGLVQMPTNTSSGADGLTLYYPNVIVGTANGTTQVIVTAVVASANAGSFNTIQLIDGNGNPLNYTVLSGNSGTGMTNLAYGGVVSFLVTISSGSIQVQFKAQTAENGTVVSTSANSNTILVTSPATPTGIMNVSPNYFNLTPNSESQIITLVNSGNGAISDLSVAPSEPLTKLSSTCGDTLAAGATCQYVVKFNKDIPKDGTSGVTVNYNNGSTLQSATATVNYTGVDPVAGLNITSNNPNFDFTTRTSTPSQTALVTLTNSGNSDESGFSFSKVTYFTTNTDGVDNPCTPSTILAPGANCSVNLVYNNATPATQTTVGIPVSYKYGQTALTANSSISVTYETIQSVAILAITPNPTNFTGIVNNGVDNNTQTLSVTNSGDATATLTNNVISGSNAALFSLPTNTAPTPCGATLAASSSCNLMVKFGPSSAAAGAESASLDVSYTPYTSASATTTSTALSGQLASAQSAVITQGAATASGFAGGTGIDQANQYQVQQSATAPTLSYTITNNGTVPATNFYVSGSPSSGWTMSGCGSGNLAAPVTLATSDGSCTLTFTLNTAILGARNLDLSTLTMYWVDQDSPSGQSQPMNGMVYANVYAPAAIALTPTTLSIAPSATATVTASLTGGYNVTDQTITLSDPNSASDGLTISSNPSPCTLNTNTANCTFTVTASGAATLGSNTITVINSGSIAPSKASINVVVAVPYVISWNPATLYIAPGGSNSSILTIAGGANINTTVTISGTDGITLSSNQQTTPGNTTSCVFTSSSSCVVTAYVPSATAFGTTATLTAVSSDGVSVPNLNINVKQLNLYTTNTSSNLISICPLTSIGDLGACTTSSGNNISGVTTLNIPIGITFAAFSGQNYAYVTNFGSGTVSKCVANIDGTLGICSILTIASAGKSSLEGINIYSINGVTYAYIANTNGGSQNTVYICPIDSTTGDFGTCTASIGNGTFKRPDGVTLQIVNGTLFGYIANQSARVSVCPINADGSFGTCASSLETLTYASGGIQFNTINGSIFGYVTSGFYGGNNSVNVCPVNNDSSFGTCVNTIGSSFDVPWGITSGSFNGTTNMYIANGSTNINAVSICPVNSDGSLSACATNPANNVGGTSTLSRPVSLTVF